MPQRGRQRSLWTGLAVAAVLVAAAIGAGVYFATHRGPSISAEAARELIRIKNVGIGKLENQDIPQGRQAFETVVAQVPAEPLGARNLAVADVLALGVEFEPAPQPDIAAAQKALDELLRLEGKNTAWDWLSLRAAMAQRDFTAAEQHLDALLKQDPQDAAAWYVRYQIRQLAGQAEIDAQGFAALQKAHQLLPGNSWLLVEWLRATATQLTKDFVAIPAGEPEKAAAISALQTKYADLPEQLLAAKPTVQPFAHVIQAHARVDALAMLTEGADAARQSDFQTAATRMRILANVLVPHSTLDQRPMRRHPLEFLSYEFRPEFYRASGVAEVAAEPAIPVKFAPSEAWQVAAEVQAELGDVLDLTLADFDLDGRLDLIVLTPQAVAVLSRPAGGNSWKVVAQAPASGMTRLVVQDLDADFDEVRGAIGGKKLDNVCPSADVDIAVYGPAGVTLVENRFDKASGQRTLVPVAGDKWPAGITNVRALTCADLDADGDLDLVVATDKGLVLVANNGDWDFADISPRSALPDKLLDAAQLVAFDWDRDVDIDVLVAAPSGGGWLENLRHGQFRWHPFAEEMPALAAAAALAPVDADRSATWDLLAAGKGGLRLAKNSGLPGGTIRLAPPAAVSDLAATGLAMCDYDNDGVEDCLAWSPATVQLYRGQVDGKFQVVDLLAGQPPQTTRAVAGDLDRDGDQDLAIVAGGRIRLLENQGGNQNHWIDVALVGQQIKGQQYSPSGRVSPQGIGSVLELKAGLRYQARLATGESTHFGLGRASEADVIRIGWLNGVPQNIIRPAAAALVCEQQVLNTSCPYLYAWNGERFAFVTDLLWNAPLGLQLAEGQLAPCREWEYLKIPAESLVAKDGQYTLQVTAELWEAEYFDEVRLIAVDHPAEFAVYSNEKVGPAEIAQKKIHTARRPRTPVAARNHAGRDLLPEIARQDGVFARPFERKLRQGVVEDHFLELDLGDLGDAQQVTLFLTGWVYPAATSINVALSQGGSVAPPRPPSLEVPDGQGGWKTALPFMGFPGGKTKTIAIPLDRAWWATGDEFKVQSSKFKVGDQTDSTLNVEPGTWNSARLRIRTSMELYWDQIFFTVDEPPGEVRMTELALVAADLHPRGFSRVVRDEGNGPEQFLYDEVSTTPKWPPIEGKFTRFGDVRELLAESDDRLLVMWAGDEATLRFAVPDRPLPAGWKRDFLLYSVGWDKDANLQTVLGQSSEPLPFRAMSAYPWPPDEKTPDSPAYREYMRKYQTRQPSHAYWNAIRRFAPAEAHN